MILMANFEPSSMKMALRTSAKEPLRSSLGTRPVSLAGCRTRGCLRLRYTQKSYNISAIELGNFGSSTVFLQYHYISRSQRGIVKLSVRLTN